MGRIDVSALRLLLWSKRERRNLPHPPFHPSLLEWETFFI